MGKVVLPLTRKTIYRGVGFSLGSTIVVSLFITVFDKQLGYSILLGGMLWFIPELYVAYRLFHRMEMNPKRLVMIFFSSEVVKLFLVALLFILLIKTVSVDFIGLISGYFLAQIVFLIKGIR